MAQSDSVAQLTSTSFGNFLLASATQVSLSAVGNAVVALPILSGGLTKGNATTYSGSVIIRRVTIQNPSGNASAGNVTILTSNDGNTSNAVTTAAGTTLSNLTGTGTWQDLTIISPFTTTVVNGYNTQAFYLLVNTGGNVAQTVDIRIYGDTVQG
jgi:hypothetical protein